MKTRTQRRRATHSVAMPTRRRLLGGLGAGLALAPLIPYLGARAEDGDYERPLNLVLVYHPNGLEEGWAPTGTGDQFELGRILASLEPHRDDILVAQGFEGGIANEILAHNEGMVSMWTGKRLMDEEGFSEYPSIDQIVADAMGSLAPFRSLEFGIQSVAGTSLSNSTAMCYRDGQPIRAEDRERIDRHADFVRETELRLEALDDLSCELPIDPVDNGAALAGLAPFFPEATAAQMDLLTVALACGITRVASLQFGNSTTGVPIAGHAMHGTMHAGTREEKLQINEWFVQQLSALLDRLRAVEYEDGTTLLDDTLVVWGTEMAVGNHLNFPIPYILAGGGLDGYFRLGHSVDLSEDRPRHTRLLISVLHAMGLTDVNQLGDFAGANEIDPLEELRRA